MLISVESLKQLSSDTAIVDLDIYDDGNVAGSLHDKTITTENSIIITNISHYPKRAPHEASKLWSEASAAFIEKLSLDDPIIETARIC